MPERPHCCWLCRPLIVLLLVAYSVPVYGAIRVGFKLHESLQHATHIVVVERNHEAPDEPYEVVETWRGELKAGYQFSPSELDLEVPGSKMTIGAFQPQELGKPVKGDRLVLFLIDITLGDPPWFEKSSAERRRRFVRWVPANPAAGDRFGKSAVWLEDGKTYWLRQFVNPGPLVPMSEFSSVEFELHIKAHELLAAKLDRAIEQGDAETLAGVSAEAARRDFRKLLDKSIEALGQCEPDQMLALAKVWVLDLELERYFGYTDRLQEITLLMARSNDPLVVSYATTLFHRYSQRFIAMMDKSDDKRWTNYSSNTYEVYGRLCAALKGLNTIPTDATRKRLAELNEQFQNNPEWQPSKKIIERYGDARVLVKSLLDASPVPQPEVESH